MKKTCKPILVLMLLFAFNTSCKKDFIKGYDEDPNVPSEVPPNLQLPTAQVAASSIYGDDYARFSEMFMQHQAGTDRQFKAIDKYIVNPSDVDNEWTFNAYPGAMVDLSKLINESGPKGNWGFSGISKIMMASSIGVLSDLFGDIPYSEAFNPDKTLTPKFDSQQQIYASIQQLLTEAKVEMKKTNVIKPGTSDLIYGGDFTKWEKAANSLSARYYLHLSKIDVTNATKALDAIDAGAISSNAEDMQLNFGTTEPNGNWWYQFKQQRLGYISMGKTLVDLMNGLNDPRRNAYMDSTGIGFVGSPNGNAQAAAVIGSFYASINSPIPFITYVEVKFIEAEAAFRAGNLIRSADAYNTAVKASLAKFNASNVAYETTNASETSASITLSKIMTQKYIALFTQIETWTDWRRTGIPALVAATGNVTGNVIPRRLIYPQSEILYNKNTPSGVTLTNKVWWDQ